MDIKIFQMDEKDLEILKDILIRDFDEFWSFNTLKEELECTNSYYIVAKENNKVIGMARLIGDYGTHGLITDVVVLPNYQNRQIGSQLVLKIKDYVFDFLEEDEQFLIELCPVYGKRNFYQRLGFKYKPTNIDGMYLWIKKGKENE